MIGKYINSVIDKYINLIRRSCDYLDRLILPVYYYKGKPYAIEMPIQFKVGDVWNRAVMYRCLYDNKDGRYWVRKEDDFFRLFKYGNIQ